MPDFAYTFYFEIFYRNKFLFRQYNYGNKEISEYLSNKTS